MARTFLTLGKVAIGAGGVLALIAVFNPFFSFNSQPQHAVEVTVGDGRSDKSSEGRSDVEIVRFLDRSDFDPSDSGTAVVLHPLATGSETQIVRDPDILATAADAFFTDNPTAETRFVLLSVIFLSPPTNSVRAPFVSIFRNGREIATYTCFSNFCNKPGHRRDLAGLLQGGKSVEDHFETVIGADAARDRMEEIATSPDLWLTALTDKVDPIADRWPGYVQVVLPGSVVLTEASGMMEPWGENAEDDMRALMQRLGVSGEIQKFYSGASNYGFPLRDSETGQILTDENGHIVHFDRIATSSPRMRIWTDAEGAKTLRASIQQLEALGNPTLPSETEITDAINLFLTELGIDADGATYKIRLEVDIATEPSVGLLQADEYLLTYYSIRKP